MIGTIVVAAGGLALGAGAFGKQHFGEKHAVIAGLGILLIGAGFGLM